MELTDELLNYLDVQRAEFPRPADPSPGPSPNPNPNPGPLPSPNLVPQPNPEPTPASGGKSMVLPSGTILNGRAELLALLGAENGSLLKEERQGNGSNDLLAKAADQQEPYRFITENISGKASKLEAGAFMGRGGSGKLTNVQHSWVFNRITDSKRDVAIRANGYLASKSASGDTPKMKSMEELLKEHPHVKDLWAHSMAVGSRGVRITPVRDTVYWVAALQEPENGTTFSAANFLQWRPSREENTSTGLECKGTLRVAFEVSPEANELRPDNSPNANGCCLFMRKSLTLKDKQLLVH